MGLAKIQNGTGCEREMPDDAAGLFVAAKNGDRRAMGRLLTLIEDGIVNDVAPLLGESQTAINVSGL